MERQSYVNDRMKSIFLYCGSMLLTFFILAGVMRLWRADLLIPFTYHGDGVFTQESIKGMIDNGWILTNSYLGAPFGADMYDFPNSDSLIYVIMKCLTIFTHEVGLIVNLTFLLSFFLTTLSALYVLRKFGLTRIVALSLSLLYTFLPYHFFRGEGHFFLSFYCQVPLLIMCALWIIDGEFTASTNGSNRVWNLFKQKKFWISILICLLSSCMGIYYAFFACFFIFLAGIISVAKNKKITHLVVSVVLVGVLMSGVIVNVAPKIINDHTNGKNTMLGKRSAIETEIYGLKITQLLLPVSGHRIAFLDRNKGKYDANAPLVNENFTVSLGVVGSLGFVVLIFMAVLGPFLGGGRKVSRLKELSVLNISGIILATIGGFGMVLALLLFSEIRAYNRIVVYIAFLSLFGAGLTLDKLIELIKRDVPRKLASVILPLLILVVGVYDQTTAHFVPDYSGIKASYENDKLFVSQIENTVPKNSMIYQLPYVPFPEYPPVNMMEDYDLFRPYLVSKDLRWTYGTIKGREGDIWYKATSSQPVEKMLNTISLSGFNGIYIDTFGYSDQAKSLIDELSLRLNEQPLISTNKRFVFFSTMNFNEILKAQYQEDDYKIAQDKALDTSQTP